MKVYKLFFYCFLLLIFSFQTEASGLKFKEDGKFKIIQVTDTHIVADSVANSMESVSMLRQVLDAEKPDLVIFTGDIVTGKPYKKGFEMLIEPVLSRRIPFATLLGNHDHEQDLSREEVGQYLMTFPENLGQMEKVNGVTGIGNYVLEIKDKKGRYNKAILYCMDSNAYSTIPGVRGYGWFTPDQVAWYRSQSDTYKADNRGVPLPALAFFHIPLLEYRLGYMDTTHVMIGTQMEKVCSPEINTGMFAAMLMQGDVMGTFVGHDHVNDYIFNHFGIALAYGRFSGSKNTYTELKNGVRVIELTEDESGFDTWIRLDDKQVIHRVKFPEGLR
ncbi:MULTISPECIES: metallophosphoesterase family protein [unclassified Parabacteroides]|uniref:metallophosphoesterase family protein n=1 Tax=unclassified Parabacteroides TaxID=2649774 RepID=UPI0024771F3C|nr:MULTISPECIES: metallophosphoesterase family protein [unclassified Parabacteroides]